MRRILALGFLTVALIVVPSGTPAFACDCGGLLPSPNSEASVQGERAILSLRDGIQTTQLLLDVASDASIAGLIIPTPSPATVSIGQLSDFDAIESAMLPRPRYVEDWWGVHSIVNAVRNSDPKIPVVLDRVTLGPIQSTTVAASDSEALVSWLTTNNVVLPEGSATLLEPYVTQGWSFVLLTLSSSGELDGTLEPITVTFATDDLVYPARLFQNYSKPHSVRLYVVGDDRVEPVRSHEDDAEPTPIDAAQQTVWAAKLLPGEVESGKFLTVLDVRFDVPARQAVTDIYFADAKANDEVTANYTVVRPMTLLGIPFGTVLVGSALIALIVLSFVFLSRMRVR